MEIVTLLAQASAAMRGLARSWRDRVSVNEWAIWSLPPWVWENPDTFKEKIRGH